MGWDVVDDGLKVVFSRDIPALVRKEIGALVAAFLERERLALSDIAEFCCHPGGAKVCWTRWRTYSACSAAVWSIPATCCGATGDMSAATVLFVLAESLAAGGGGRRLLTTIAVSW